MGVCQALRQALQSGEPVVAPLCYDPLTSKLVAHLGFPAAYLGGGALGFVLNVTEAMIDKAQAAVEAREDPDFLIIARTNAIRQVSFAEAVERGNAYAEAGADMIMALPRTPEEARQLPKEIHKPVVYMLSIAADRRLLCRSCMPWGTH